MFERKICLLTEDRKKPGDNLIVSFIFRVRNEQRAIIPFASLNKLELNDTFNAPQPGDDQIWRYLFALCVVNHLNLPAIQAFETGQIEIFDVLRRHVGVAWVARRANRCSLKS